MSCVNQLGTINTEIVYFEIGMEDSGSKPGEDNNPSTPSDPKEPSNPSDNLSTPSNPDDNVDELSDPEPEEPDVPSDEDKEDDNIPENEEEDNLEKGDVFRSGGAEYEVTSIARNAFRKNKNIKKVVVGNNVQTIGSNAFQGGSACAGKQRAYQKLFYKKGLNRKVKINQTYTTGRSFDRK